jgi:hypothetical protein
LVEINCGDVSGNIYIANISNIPMIIGKKIYSQNYSGKRRIQQECITMEINNDVIHSNCAGVAGFSGSGYFDIHGELSGIHLGGEEDESDSLNIDEKWKINEKLCVRDNILSNCYEKILENEISSKNDIDICLNILEVTESRVCNVSSLSKKIYSCGSNFLFDSEIMIDDMINKLDNYKNSTNNINTVDIINKYINELEILFSSPLLLEEEKKNWTSFDIDKDFVFDNNIKGDMKKYFDDFKNNTKTLFDEKKKCENILNVKCNFGGISKECYDHIGVGSRLYGRNPKTKIGDAYLLHNIFLQNYIIKQKCVIVNKININDCRNYFIT